MTNISLIFLDECFGQRVEAIKVVAGVCDTLGLEPKPPDHLFDCNKILFLLPLRICIVET